MTSVHDAEFATDVDRVARALLALGLTSYDREAIHLARIPIEEMMIACERLILSARGERAAQVPGGLGGAPAATGSAPAGPPPTPTMPELPAPSTAPN